MPRVNRMPGVTTQFRWVAPDFVSDKPFRVIEDREQIAYWEKRFERWKEELDRMRDTKMRRRGMIQYLHNRSTPLRTMLIEEELNE